MEGRTEVWTNQRIEKQKNVWMLNGKRLFYSKKKSCPVLLSMLDNNEKIKPGNTFS